VSDRTVPRFLALKVEGELGGAFRPFILSLGSNLGDRSAHLRRGLEFLASRVRIDAVSRVVETAPWGDVTSQPDFLNLVARGSSGGQASDLLRLAHEAEAAAGRARTVPGGPRSLDVDLIFFGDLQIHSPSLQLPHPHWAKRPFVHRLIPEVAGDMVDPETGKALRELPGLDPLAQDMRLVAPVPWMNASQGSPFL